MVCKRHVMSEGDDAPLTSGVCLDLQIRLASILHPGIRASKEVLRGRY